MLICGAKNVAIFQIAIQIDDISINYGWQNEIAVSYILTLMAYPVDVTQIYTSLHSIITLILELLIVLPCFLCKAMVYTPVGNGSSSLAS